MAIGVGMSYGPSPSGGETGFNWEEAFRKIQAQRIANQGSVAGSPGRMSSTDQLERNRSSTPIGTSGSYNQSNQYNQLEQNRSTTPVKSAIRSTGVGADVVPRNDMTQKYNFDDRGGTNPFGKPSSSWYAGQITEGNEGALAQDPSLYGTRYAQSKGYGKGVENMLNQYLDPTTNYLLQLGSRGDDSPTNRLNFAGSQMDFAMRKSDGQHGFNNTGDVQSILGATPDSVIGSELFGGGNEGNSQGQVESTTAFLEAALYGKMSPEVLGPYLAMVEREGQLFNDFYMQNPQSNLNFGQWLLQKFGPNGGL